MSKKLIKEGHSESLKTRALQPGWTAEESEVLKVGLMKFGIGKWT